MLTHRLDSGLELAVEELQAVVEDVLIGGVQAGLDAVPHHIGGPGRTLQLQDLHMTAHGKIRQMALVQKHVERLDSIHRR